MEKDLMLSQIRNYCHLHRNKDFADFFGLSEQCANGWKNKKYLDLRLIYQKCPDINPEWLLSDGECGEMLRPAKEQTAIGDNNTQVGGDMGPSNETISKMVDALAKEQSMCSAFQDQVNTLIQMIGHTIKGDNK